MSGMPRPAESPRPVVGITCYVEPVDRGDWNQQLSVALPMTYVEQVQRAGGIPVVLPPRLDADDAIAAATLASLDALILCGGADVESSRYDEAPHPSVQAARPDRDAWELALARVSAAADLPVLGICRGMQVMAVAARGRLEQHVPDRTGTEIHSPHIGSYASHPIQPVAGTRVASILGEGRQVVPTYHHQAVRPDSLADTAYRPAAWHEDGTLEAMEDPAARFRIAVQWHPEAGSDPRLFDALLEAAAQR
jgi:putative glutamine amidotransferase